MILEVIEKEVTLDSMRRFMGDIKDSIHADEGLADKWGLGGAVAQGGHLVAFLNEAMLRAYGTGFCRGGEISVSFIKAVRPGDRVKPKIEVAETTEVDGRGFVRCNIWLENQSGEKVTVGTAGAFTE